MQSTPSRSNPEHLPAPVTLAKFLTRRNFITAAAAQVLSGCSGPVYAYRIELFLSLRTPAGIRDFSHVVQITEFIGSTIDTSKLIRSIVGEALCMNIDTDRLVFALLSTNVQHRHGLYFPIDELKKMYNGCYYWDDSGHNDCLGKLITNRGLHEIGPEQLPDFVRFADPSRPETVALFDPANLTAELGAGYRWESLQLGFTDKPITRNGTLQQLPWLIRMRTEGGMLDGQKTQDRRLGLANQLTSLDFIEGL